MLDIREVEAFLAVAEELHFGRAGERLGVSTSRVSGLVRAFERRVRTTLFERTSREVKLTEAGRRLFAELCPAYTWMQRAIAQVRDAAEPRGSVLRVGFSTTLPPELVDKSIAAFEERYTSWRVVKSEYPTSEVLRWLHQDWPVDVFVTWLPGEPALLGLRGMHIGPVAARVPRVVLVGADHPLAVRASVDVEELAAHEVIAFGELPEGVSRVWTPRVTPNGRPMALRWLNTVYLEEAIRAVVHEGAAHLTFGGLLDRYPRPGVVEVPVTGVGPMSVVSLWSTETPVQIARVANGFADTVAEVGGS
ncbi:LysR family transcriptional regulator [Yinghuangia seranimata]|uniref:LysR family transcriptional regulator n=1 Tax=Yinghuangia seranimata TaxID=408067 RepID=UPI00248CD0B8|nr:LysR family transcriptional regulator [Yinghuangia seranimata]MDI2127559.1 LysR family transcriptional regulator [Yinghuangia seranimata]